MRNEGRYAVLLGIQNDVKVAVSSHPSLLKIHEDFEVTALAAGAKCLLLISHYYEGICQSL